MGKSAKSFVVVAIVAVIALTFGAYASAGSFEILGLPALYLLAWLALGINWLAFVPSAVAQSDRFYDTMGAVTYLSVTALACYGAYQVHGELDIRALVVAGMVALWCIRLGAFLYTRIHAAGGADSRFEKIRVNPARFLVAWTLQALWVVLTASAAMAVITAKVRVGPDIFLAIGSAIWVLGIVWETVADNQKSAFKSNPDNAGKFINTGLWRWSRHPNYFGEIALWTGILVIALPVLSGLGWLVVVSPVFVFLLLTRISGVNLQNAQAKQRWGDDPEWQAYFKNTSMLFPLPPKKGN